MRRARNDWKPTRCCARFGVPPRWRRDELVDLTRHLIRFPTVNPPGEAYRPCAEFIGRRLERRGFNIAYVRAEGTPGDNGRYPRVNVVVRRKRYRAS